MSTSGLSKEGILRLFQKDINTICNVDQEKLTLKKATISSFNFDLLTNLENQIQEIEFYECVFESIDIERKYEIKKELNIALNFYQCEFKKFEMKNIDFCQNLLFIGCTFRGNVNLSRNTFRSLTMLASTFTKELRMIQTTCMMELKFDESIMQERIILNNSIFKTTSFKLCQFEGLTKFSKIKFGEKTIFKDSIFYGKTVFDYSHFNGDVNFGIATFNGETKFLSTIFDEEAKFQATTFGEKVFFDSTQFKKAAIFSTAKFLNESRFIGTKFHQEMNFSDIIFKNTHFSQAIFIKSAQFLNVVFDDLANFFQTNFQGEANFSGSLFKGVANFDQTRFLILPNFLRCTFCNQFNIDYNQIRFQENIAHFVDQDSMAWQDLLRKLKSNRIASHNIIESSEFRINELYMREENLKNKEDKTPKEWIERWQLWLYRHTSDHHTNLLRIISWVIVAIGIFGVINFGIKYIQDPSIVKKLNPYGITSSFVGSILALPFCTTIKKPFFKLGRYLVILSSISTLWIACYKPTLIFGAMNLIDKSPRSGFENLILVLYTLVMILLLFSLQKTARKNSIVPN